MKEHTKFDELMKELEALHPEEMAGAELRAKDFIRMWKDNPELVEIRQLCSLHLLPKSVHKRLTRYSDESKNVLFCCDKCIEEDNEMDSEMWREYYSGQGLGGLV
jgi:hypothetical protein